MFLSVIITTYWVLGVKYDKEKQTPFKFILPFTAFRDVNNEMYWQEVVDKIYEISGARAGCDIYVATQEEYLLSSDYFKNVVRISDILTKNKLPLVYLGETRGSVQGVVAPFIINPNDFYRWFYLAENINSVENYFYNRRAYGVREPDGSWEQGFEESLFREKLTYLIENTRSDFFEKTKDLILTGEGVIFAGGNKRIVLSFLDSAKPGFWRIYIDKDTLLLNLEVVKLFNEQEYKNRSEKIKVEDLAGCLVVPNATRLELKDASNNLTVNLEEDSISVIPFDKDSKYQVKVFVSKNSTFFEASGGELGLIVDNRIRPLLRDKSSKQRIGLIEKWTKEISQKVDLGNVNQDEAITPIKKKILESDNFDPKFKENKVGESSDNKESKVSKETNLDLGSSMFAANNLLSEGNGASEKPKVQRTKSQDDQPLAKNSNKDDKNKPDKKPTKKVPKTTDMKKTIPLEEETTDSTDKNFDFSDNKPIDDKKELGILTKESKNPKESTSDKELEELVQKELAKDHKDEGKGSTDVRSSYSKLGLEIKQKAESEGSKKLLKKTEKTNKGKIFKTNKDNPKLRPGEKVL